MVIDFILLGLIIISIVGVLVVIIRKLPVLAAIDTAATATNAEIRKSSILEERLKRKFTSGLMKVRTGSAPIIGMMNRLGKNTQKKLVDLEHEYKVRGLPVLMNKMQHRKVQEEIGDICAQARALFADGEHAAAEEKALQAIRLDPRSIAAFELLGELYLATKEYGQAKEVYLYLIKLATDPHLHVEHADTVEADAQRNLSEYYVDMAEAERGLEQWDASFQAIAQALSIEENNPKILDAYIEIAIRDNRKLEAQEAVDRMKTVNPENMKIDDWEAQISAIDNLHHHIVE